MLKSVAVSWESFNRDVLGKSKVPVTDAKRKAIEMAFYAGALGVMSQWQECLHNEDISDAQAFEHFEALSEEVRAYFLALAMDIPALKH